MEQYIGVDLHKAFFQVAAVNQDGARLWEDRFPHSPIGIAAFIGRCLAPSRIAVEASGPTWAFADAVVGDGRVVVIVDPRKTRLKAGHAAKTDRLDARRLADALRRESVVSVYYPPVAVRQLRELCRYRASLVRLRVGVKQRIHALLLRYAIQPPPCSDLFGVRGRRWLATVDLPGFAAGSLAGHRQLLAWVTEQLASATADVQREAARDPIAQALDRVIGIGPILGLCLRAEIGDVARFADGAHLASYAGLVPAVDQRGGHCDYGAITREGSPWLRWAFVEAAMHRTHRRDALGHWAMRLALRKGALKARVAVARRLCHDVLAAWPRPEALSASVVEELHERAVHDSSL